MFNIKSKTIPKTTGIYFFRNKHGKILYIGKAVNLRSRVSSYFNKRPKDTRILKMLEMATNVTWQKTASEIEALILESQLIKKHKPQFNVMLRDDKQYFYVSFTNDKFPRIYLTHQPQFYLPPKISNDKFQITNQIPSQNVKIKHSEKNWKL